MWSCGGNTRHENNGLLHQHVHSTQLQPYLTGLIMLKNGILNKTLNQENNNPPCFLRYRGSPGEVITSFLSSLIEPVSVENERSYCPFDDLETSGRGTITSFGSSVDINILTCARNQERWTRDICIWYWYPGYTGCVGQTAEGCGSYPPGPHHASSTSMVQQRP